MLAEERFLTIEEVAERLRVSDRTVRRWIDSGRLHAYKPGGVWRIRASDLDAFLETRSFPKAGAPSASGLPEVAGPFNEVVEEERRTRYLKLLAAYIEVFAQKVKQELEAGRVTPAWGLSLYGETTGLGMVFNEMLKLTYRSPLSESDAREAHEINETFARHVDETQRRLDEFLESVVSEQEREEQKATVERRFKVIQGELGA